MICSIFEAIGGLYGRLRTSCSRSSLALCDSNFMSECWYPDLYCLTRLSSCWRCFAASPSVDDAAAPWPRPLPGLGGGGAPGLLNGEDPLPAPGAVSLSSLTLSIIPANWSVEDASVDFLGGMISSSSENTSVSFLSVEASRSLMSAIY